MASTALTFTSQDAFNAAARKAGGETFAAEHLTVETFKAGKAAKLDLTVAGRDFKIGAVAKYALKRNIETTPAKALAYAILVADKKKPPQDAAKRDDTHRTEGEHNAWSAAGMRLTSLLRGAGVIDKAAKPTKPDAPKAPAPAAPIKDAPIELKIAAPKLTQRDDALIFARDIAAMMTRTLNASAKSDALKGEAGSILRGMLTDFQNGIADIEKALAKG